MILDSGLLFWVTLHNTVNIFNTYALRSRKMSCFATFSSLLS